MASYDTPQCDGLIRPTRRDSTTPKNLRYACFISGVAPLASIRWGDLPGVFEHQPVPAERMRCARPNAPSFPLTPEIFEIVFLFPWSKSGEARNSPPDRLRRHARWKFAATCQYQCHMGHFLATVPFRVSFLDIYGVKAKANCQRIFPHRQGRRANHVSTTAPSSM